MKICVYGASSSAIDTRYLIAGESLGRLMAQRGHVLIFGGGAHGLMGAVARGMAEGGGQIIGVAPRFFQVDGVLYEHCTEFLYTDTMRERKQLMEDSADAFLMTPGGIGTFEEFFEILTLRQLGRHTKPIAILNTLHYFDPLLQLLETAIEQRFMQSSNRSLYRVCDDPSEALDALASAQPQTGTVEEYKFF